LRHETVTETPTLPMIEHVTPPPPCLPGPQSCRDPRWSLVVAILGSSMAFVDGTVVNTALPLIQRALGAGLDAAQWIVESYALLLASLVLVGGALGDRLGRRRIFVTGVTVFAIASAACGLAASVTWLIVARGAQGVGAALLVPGSLALITAAYPESARGAAIGTWSATTGIAAAIGPILGGWVIAHASWRWLFFFNVPAAVATLLVAKRVAESRDEQASARIDLGGALLATLGLGCVVWALLEAPNVGGIGSPASLAPLVAGMGILVAFVVVEARVRQPMVPLGLFRSRAFAGASLVTALLYAALGACLFFVPFNLIEVQRYSAAASGAALLPLVVFLSLLSRWAGKVAARVGPRIPMVAGSTLTAVGFLLLAAPGVGGSYWTTFFPGLSALGIGMGLTVTPLTATAMSAAGTGHAGVASGISNAIARTASLVAVAALGVLMLNRFDAALTRELDTVGAPYAVRSFVEAQASSLAAAQLPANMDDPTRAALRGALDLAFVNGFRWLMAACGLLAGGSTVAALALLGGTDVGAPFTGASPASGGRRGGMSRQGRSPRAG
jgi:EmrB/QacA subfamily drug resistance transporter